MEAAHICSQPGCGRKFDTPKDLALHIERRHKTVEKQPQSADSAKDQLPKIDYERLFLEDGIYESLEEVEQIVATNREIKVFEPQKQIDAAILANIVVLSLSHNKLQSIDFLQFFPYLKELNLNNNLIENLWYISL